MVSELSVFIRASPSLDANDSIGLRSAQPAALAEGESVGTDTGVEESDLEGPIRDRARLPDQLIEARLENGARSVGIDIEAVIRSGGRAVEHDAKANWL